MMQTEDTTENPATNTSAKADPTPTQLSRAELVKELNRWVKDTADFWEPMFERMRDNIDFAGGDQWDAGKVDPSLYQVNFVQRQLNQDVASKYARNPTVTIERKKRLEHRFWDGTLEQLQQAKAALEQAAMLALQTAQAGGPPQPPPAAESQIVQDYAAGLQRKKLFDRIAETLEYLITIEMEEQRPDFESEMKSLSLREGVTGAGFLFIKFQRETETVPTTTATTVGVLEKMQAIQARARELADDPMYSQDSACAEELKLMIQSLQAQLEQQDVKLLREGVVFDFKPTTSVLIDPACRSLHEFVGACRIAELLYLTPMQVQAQWGVDVKKHDGTVRYADDGTELSFSQDKKGRLRDDNGKFTNAWPEKAKVRVAIVYDKSTQMEYAVCDGYPDFLKEPAQPWPPVKGFWPIAALKYQRIEVEKNKPKEGITIFGQSKVDLMRPMQCELNRSQEAVREHRISNRPGYIFSEGSIDAGEAALIGGMPANSGLGLKNVPPGTDLRGVIVPKPTVPLDPALYSKEGVMNDVYLAVGSQSSNLGMQQGNEKATGQAIAEQSRVTGVSSEVDEQDKFLTEALRIAGEMLMQGMQESTVKRKVGPGAIWPLSSRGPDGMQPDGVITIEDCLDQLIIKIEAASSGRANQALDIANWKEMWPSLLAAAQALGLSLAPLLKEQAKILNFKFDLDEWLASAAMNPMGMPGQMGQPMPAGGQPQRPQPGQQTGTAPDPAGMKARIGAAPAG